MLELIRYDLRNPQEWEHFCNLFSAYLAEVCGEEEYRENIDDLHNEELSRQLVEQTLQQHNPYFVMQIVSDGKCAGIISYSLKEERSCGFINNFYIRPEYRNAGTGTIAYHMAESQLKSLGAGMIELIPVKKALPFYTRNGFIFSRTTADGEPVYRKTVE